uniref:Uncharacterized protein n=1 Tax=Timema tahoe TaxID=61484 RepID=A0A7R9IMA7_9NEOP|nr:unnamed protein product [Timema tahoe]
MLMKNNFLVTLTAPAVWIARATKYYETDLDLVAELPFILMHPKPEEETLPPTARPSPSHAANKDNGDDMPVDANLIQLDTSSESDQFVSDSDFVNNETEQEIYSSESERSEQVGVAADIDKSSALKMLVDPTNSLISHSHGLEVIKAVPSRTIFYCRLEHLFVEIDGHDPDDDIIFEDFARLRLKGGETDA